MSSLPESSVPVESITALLGQITATGANAFGQISPTWRSSCRAAFAGKVRRIAAANELRPMAMRHRIFKLSPLSCVESLRIIQAPDPLHNWQSNNPTRTGPSPLSPSLSHAAWHCAGMSSPAEFGNQDFTRARMDRPPIAQASGEMLRRASGPTPIDQASTSSSLSEIERPVQSCLADLEAPLFLAAQFEVPCICFTGSGDSCTASHQNHRDPFDRKITAGSLRCGARGNHHLTGQAIEAGKTHEGAAVDACPFVST